MQRLRDNIYVETGFIGCNPSFISTAEGVVMIDTPQKPSEAFEWREQIQRHGSVKYIINTDHHRDHALGNYYFDGDIVAHGGTMERLHEEGSADSCKKWITLMEPESESLMVDYVVRKPSITYKDRMTIFLGDAIFQLIHVTSHTRDETIVYMPREKIVFTGDTVCTNGIPGLGESFLKEWIEALQFIEGLDFNILVPGHGDPGDKTSVVRFRRELNLLMDRVRQQMDKGLGRDEIIERTKYEDHVHSRYPSCFSEYFEGFMKKNIGRLVDELVRNE